MSLGVLLGLRAKSHSEQPYLVEGVPAHCGVVG